MADAVEMLEADEALDVESVTASKSNLFTVTLEQYQGHCHIKWQTDCPARFDPPAVALYSGKPPSDPNKWIWAKKINTSSGSYDTGKIWGSGYSAAFLGGRWGSGSYTYVVKTDVTK